MDSEPKRALFEVPFFPVHIAFERKAKNENKEKKRILQLLY